MTTLALLLILLLTAAIVVGAMTWVSAERALKFSLNYAQDKAEELLSKDINDPAGAAYSHMATIIVLSLDRHGRELVEKNSL